MLDLKFIREYLLEVKNGLSAKRAKVDLDRLLELDSQRRQLLVDLEDLKAQKNTANGEISRLIKEKQDPKMKILSMKIIAQQVDAMEPVIKRIEGNIHDILIGIPNTPHKSVPVGGIEANREVVSWGDLPRLWPSVLGPNSPPPFMCR